MVCLAFNYMIAGGSPSAEPRPHPTIETQALGLESSNWPVILYMLASSSELALDQVKLTVKETLNIQDITRLV